MAILKQGSLGIFTGKIGALVISKWKDQYVGKSKPVRSSKKATVPLLSQQSKLKMASKFLRMIRSVVPFSFQKPPKNMTAMNYAMLYNLKHSISGEYPDFAVDYAKVKLSKPADYMTEIDNGYNALATVSGKEVSITWEEDDIPDFEDTNPTDRAYIFIYHPGKNISIDPMPPQRSESGIKVNLQPVFAGEIHIWIFFAADGGEFVSDTKYLGNFTMIP